MYFIYSILYFCVMLVLLPYEYSRRPKELRARWLRERFGFFDSILKEKDSNLIWVHAVSVGEVISAVPFIRELKRTYPSLRILVSTVTDTGQKVAYEKLSDIAHIVYVPFDLVVVLKRLLKRVRPDVFLVMETELWPNILRVFNSEKIPVVLINGRISDDSFKGYRKISFFMRRVLSCVDLFCMQEQIYKERIQALGADEGKVRVVGNFKFDTEPSGRLPDWSGYLKGPVILAGSTHEGEEELLVSVFEKLIKEFPELNLILAPRHPERFGRVEEMVKARGLSVIKRSQIKGCGTEQMQDSRIASSIPQSAICNPQSGVIFILDSIGELASAYGIADIAVIGGSFSSNGGHNPLEPAFWGKPVVCGPHMENFPFIQEFFIGSGAIKTDSEGLYDVLKELSRSPQKRTAMGERAKTFYNKKAGAVKGAVGILQGYLEPKLLLSGKKSLS